MNLMHEGKIWIYKNKVLVTDPPNCLRRDAVLPLCHENRFLVEHMRVPANGTVLDLCAGSGVLSIFAAERANSVVGVDINPRAIEFATFNSALNGIDHKIEWLVGDLFGPVKGMRFDAIVTNPPFEPTPDGCPNYLHSDGGGDGLDIIRKIIEQVPEYLEPHGTFQMVAWLPTKSSWVLDCLSKSFGRDRVLVRSLFRFSLTDYVKHRNELSHNVGLSRTSKTMDDLLHYVYIHVLPTKASFSKQMEVHHIGKAISTTRALV